MPQGQVHSYIPYLIAGLLVIAMLAWRLRRMSQTRPLRLELMWVTPLIFLALGVLTVLQQPPQGVDWVYIAAALLIGGGFGWWRGKLMHITVDPESHSLETKASPAGMILIVAILVIRFALRGVAMGPGSGLHLSLVMVTDVSMAFIVGLMVVQRIEMFLRATRLLVQARTAKAAVVP